MCDGGVGGPEAVCSDNSFADATLEDNPFAAAVWGDITILRRCVNSSNVNNCDEEGRTVLHLASTHAHGDCMRYCVEVGGNLEAVDKNYATILHVAVMRNNVFIVKLILAMARKHGVYWSLLQKRDWRQATPLCIAIRVRLVECVWVLLCAGGTSPLTIPAWMYKLLPKFSCHRASIVVMGIRKYRRGTPMDRHDAQVIRMLAKYIWSTRESWLLVSDESLCPESVRIRTISHLSRLACDGGEGRLILHRCAHGGFAKLIEWYLSLEVSAYYSDGNGQTPLHIAVIAGHRDCVEVLCPRSSINAIDHDGKTALFYAIQSDRRTIAKRLLLFGASLGNMENREKLPNWLYEVSGESESDEI
jgi:ankyrin repeat protein